MSFSVKKESNAYKSLNVLLAAEDDLGHVLDLERGIGTFASQISGAGGLVVVDSMALEAGLDREVVLHGVETGHSCCRVGVHFFMFAE